jgi:hypothetical protein
LVVGQVPLEHIELVQGHGVQETFDLVHRLQVARRVQHQATPGEARRVVDVLRGDALGGRREQQLQHAHGAVEHAVRVGRLDPYALRADVERVGLRLARGTGRTRQRDGAGPGALCRGQHAHRPPAAAGASQVGGEDLRDAQQRRLTRRHLDDGVGPRNESPLAAGDGARRRHHGRGQHARPGTGPGRRYGGLRARERG